MNGKILPILLILIAVMATAGMASAGTTGTLYTNNGIVSGQFHGNSDNGAMHFYVYGHHPITYAALKINGDWVFWNHKNGAEYADIPDGYRGAVWHFVYTPSGKLTISDVTGLCPICPCPC